MIPRQDVPLDDIANAIRLMRAMDAQQNSIPYGKDVIASPDTKGDPKVRTTRAVAGEAPFAEPTPIPGVAGRSDYGGYPPEYYGQISTNAVYNNPGTVAPALPNDSSAPDTAGLFAGPPDSLGSVDIPPVGSGDRNIDWSQTNQGSTVAYVPGGNYDLPTNDQIAAAGNVGATGFNPTNQPQRQFGTQASYQLGPNDPDYGNPNYIGLGPQRHSQFWPYALGAAGTVAGVATGIPLLGRAGNYLGHIVNGDIPPRRYDPTSPLAPDNAPAGNIGPAALPLANGMVDYAGPSEATIAGMPWATNASNDPMRQAQWAYRPYGPGNGKNQSNGYYGAGISQGDAMAQAALMARLNP